MKRYDPMRADNRSIGEKALGLICAMPIDDLRQLRADLDKMASKGGAFADRVRVLCGAGGAE